MAHTLLTRGFPGLTNYLLIADDDSDDQELINDALIDSGILADRIRFVNSGEELLAALSIAEKLPSLILLDLNMPGLSGMDVLHEIRQSDTLRHLPVIIFSTSDSQSDVFKCYTLGCNAFMTKPMKYSELVSAMSVTLEYWTKNVQLIAN